MTGDGRRTRRVAEALRTHLAEAFGREVADPRLASVVITDVTVSDDLSVARVGVRLLVGDEDPDKRRSMVDSLQRATHRLRRVVAPRLRLRRAPELRFAYDTGHDATRRVEELLDEIHRAPRGQDD
jgi:ribosome-binding factor A